LNDCISILENRLSFLDKEYSKQPTLILKYKIGEVWLLLEDLKNGLG